MSSLVTTNLQIELTPPLRKKNRERDREKVPYSLDVTKEKSENPLRIDHRSRDSNLKLPDYLTNTLVLRQPLDIRKIYISKLSELMFLHFPINMKVEFN